MVTRWDIITIGNLSRNRYWGEADDHGVRPALCTCTLIQSASVRLLVDPSIADAALMAAELDRRSGLKPADINAVFVTHEHGDHWAGLGSFPSAKLFAAPAAAEAINKTRGAEPVPPASAVGVPPASAVGILPASSSVSSSVSSIPQQRSRQPRQHQHAGGTPTPLVQPVVGRLLDMVNVIPTPGHTPGHHSLLFDCDGMRVVVAGDSVMTRDFWRDRRGFHNSADFAQVARTIEAFASAADAIVPGHDNWFLTK